MRLKVAVCDDEKIICNEIKKGYWKLDQSLKFHYSVLAMN